MDGKRNKRRALPVIAVSGGDPAGIGPRIALDACLYAARRKICVPVLFTHENAVAMPAAALKKIRLVHTPGGAKKCPRPGRPTLGGAAIAFASLRAAAGMVMSGEADALVTAPVSKEWMSRIEPFSGHTEWLAVISGIDPENVVMFFSGKKSAIATVTRHIALSEVAAALKPGAITRTVALVCGSLVLDFRMKKATVGICALNPHASDGGLTGHEEKTVIEPAVAAARKIVDRAGWARRIRLLGPMGADALMRQMALGKIQACVAMYHDQAMIAAKVLEPHSSVGCTLGLPFIRTTPSHGTAFDIAASPSGRPSSESMKAAVRLAVKISSGKGGLRQRLRALSKQEFIF
ncbi:MAG: 4-hydroxythreonine-4-phosphate dehydrogenase PdxA [Pseudomonadota bacterium]